MGESSKNYHSNNPGYKQKNKFIQVIVALKKCSKHNSPISSEKKENTYLKKLCFSHLLY